MFPTVQCPIVGVRFLSTPSESKLPAPHHTLGTAMKIPFPIMQLDQRLRFKFLVSLGLVGNWGPGPFYGVPPRVLRLPYITFPIQLWYLLSLITYGSAPEACGNYSPGKNQLLMFSKGWPRLSRSTSSCCGLWSPWSLGGLFEKFAMEMSRWPSNCSSTMPSRPMPRRRHWQAGNLWESLASSCQLLSLSWT